MDRYQRNKVSITEEENNMLKNSKVCVIGCGGLGGYIIEMLGRVGVGHITAVDGDVFDITNLNRQILSDTKNIGKSKALEALKRMTQVNPEIVVQPVQEYLTMENADGIIKGHDVVVDALDNIQTRFLVKDVCAKYGVPFVHGAIAGWYGQVSTILPGDNTLEKIYKNPDKRGEEKKLGNPSFTPGLMASIQVSEVIKLLINRGELLRNKFLFVNMLDQEYEVFNL